MLAAFPQAWRWRSLRFNELVLGFDRPVSAVELTDRAAGADPELAPLARLFGDGVRPVRAVGRPLTDDRAPVEWLTDRMIIDFVSRGGDLDEDFLPTAP